MDWKNADALLSINSITRLHIYLKKKKKRVLIMILLLLILQPQTRNLVSLCLPSYIGKQRWLFILRSLEIMSCHVFRSHQIIASQFSSSNHIHNSLLKIQIRSYRKGPQSPLPFDSNNSYFFSMTSELTWGN